MKKLIFKENELIGIESEPVTEKTSSQVTTITITVIGGDTEVMVSDEIATSLIYKQSSDVIK